MSRVTLFFAAVLSAYGAWQLWTAWSRGEVLSRYGGAVQRSAQPVTFWLLVGTFGLMLAIFALALALAAWRTVHPLPFAERAGQLYPSRAMARDASGLVLLHCTVTEAYGVKDCGVTSETPPGMGFAASALQVSALFVLPQKDRASARPGQPINLPIRFKMPDPPTPTH
jgi:hypothetical protein